MRNNFFFFFFRFADGGARSKFIATQLSEFQSKCGGAEVELRRKPSRHPFALAAYVSGVNKQIGLKNLSANEVAARCEFLRAQTGRKSVKLHEQVSHVTSTQGLWSNKRVLNSSSSSSSN